MLDNLGNSDSLKIPVHTIPRHTTSSVYSGFFNFPIKTTAGNTFPLSVPSRLK